MARSSQQPVKHESAIVLLLIDFINDLEFTGGDELVRYALPAARNVARLKAAAKQRNVPCLYVNDNFEQWRSNFKLLVNSCVNGRVRGTPVAKPHSARCAGRCMPKHHWPRISISTRSRMHPRVSDAFARYRRPLGGRPRQCRMTNHAPNMPPRCAKWATPTCVPVTPRYSSSTP